MLRPSIGIDWDDVTAPFNSIAIRMANEKYHPAEPYRLEEITSWANEGRTSVIKEFYNDPELYSRQIPTEETKRGIRRLMQIAGCFFYYGGVAAVYGSAGGADHDSVPGIPAGKYHFGKRQGPSPF